MTEFSSENKNKSILDKISRKSSYDTGSKVLDDGNLSDSTNDIKERGHWANPVEFVLSCVNYAVGLGNVWRFPHLVFRNGGGAFLIPYILMVFIIGLPIFFGELFVGQYTGLGPNKAYARMAPFFHGLGYCTVVVITLVTIYYMVIVAWTIFYIYESFRSELGWGYCKHDFNSEFCYSGLEDQICKENNTGSINDMIYYNRSCTDINSICTNVNNNLIGANSSFCYNTTASEYIPVRNLIDRVLASEEFYNRYVLGIDENTSWTNWGYPRWQLVICLFLGWLIAFFCVIKGIQSAGKVVYFTVIFPYIILIALLVRGATLEGAIDGVLFYITPEWDRLASPAVWGDAASQIFYSFGIACGSLVTLSSYSRFTNNCQTDAIIVAVTNVFTAVFAGFAIFSILGFMANNMGVPVSEVVAEGPGLAFIAYPEAVLLMPLPQLWAVLFFFMMFVLGLGSQFAGIQSVNTAVIDQWPHLRNHQWRVTAGTCISCFLLGLPLVCNGGVYMFTLMDWHTASWAILLIGMAEIVIMSWVYGISKTLDNISEMGIKLNKLTAGYWRAVWVVITPIACVSVFIFIMTDIGPTKYGDYVFPQWADALGWLMGASTLAPFFIYLVYHLVKGEPSGWNLFRPTAKWGPQNNENSNMEISKTNHKPDGIDNIGFVNEK